ncbi:MAG: hypothetical protein JRJ29_00240 [Deltaproteobacteria bacterium]|nr:hypothetical protein [Deltaproteobacteria bacterium]MBW2081592.1 hypothetical protein [Deltaproteobacteria bacterium]
MSTNFPTSLDSFSTKTDNVDYVQAAHINDLQDAVEALEAKVGIDSSSVDTSIDYKVNNFFVENTRVVYLYENTAPTGWSTTGLPTDRVLAVKGGTHDYNVNGGNEAGSWQVDGLSTGNDSHKHQWYEYAGPSDADETWDSSGTQVAIDKSAKNPKGILVSGDTEGKLNFDAYTSTETHNHSVSSDSSWRPYAAVGILCKYVGA